jgi:hypothetical protein
MDKGFKEYLKSVQAKMAGKSEESPPPRQAARWNMRLLKGADVRDVELQESASNTPAGPAPPAAADQTFWKATGLSANSAKEGPGQPEASQSAPPEGRKPGRNAIPPGKQGNEPGKPASTVEKSKDAGPAPDSPKPA